METSLYCLLILLAFVLYDSGALLAAAITAGLCVLLRLDGLAVGFVLAAHRIVTTRALPLPVIIGFCTTIAPWFLFALLYFGEVRPMSMLAKTHHEFVAERFWMLGHVFNLRMIPYWGLILGAVILSGWRIGWKRSPSYQLSSGTTALALWALAYATAYTVYRIDLYLWYVAPIDMAFAIFAALGAHSILKRTRLGLWVIVIVLAARGYYSGHVLYHSIPRDNAIESARHDIAATIRDRSKPGDAIATGAIGVLGWFTGAPIYDTLGLVTKDAIGKPFAAVLETCGARWLVSEVSSEGAAAPPMKGYSLVRRFVCNDRLVFLLYERE